MACSVDGCEKKVKYSGLCSMHAERKRKYGDVNLGSFKSRGVCSVRNCQNPHYGKSYCVRHYKRWKKYGNPESGGLRKGEARDFLHKCLVAETDECINYPYYRNGSGYGWVNISGKPMGAHAYVAELVHGSKPTKYHEACHTCGKGHLGCVNPSHIYWGTRKQNVRDAMNHGTSYIPKPRSGKDHHNFKVTDDMKKQIIKMLSEGLKQKEIAFLMNLSQTTISKIKKSIVVNMNSGGISAATGLISDALNIRLTFKQVFSGIATGRTDCIYTIDPHTWNGNGYFIM